MAEAMALSLSPNHIDGILLVKFRTNGYPNAAVSDPI
jgi:hypothetical protein